jgi:hypothetical protein
MTEKFEGVSSWVFVEEKADDVAAQGVRFRPDRATSDLADLGRSHRPAHPPFGFKFLLRKGRVRPGMAQFKIAVEHRSDHMRPAGPAVEPTDLAVAKFHTGEAVFPDRRHEPTLPARLGLQA